MKHDLCVKKGIIMRLADLSDSVRQDTQVASYGKICYKRNMI